MRNNDLEFEYNNREEGYIYVYEERLEEEILDCIKNNKDVESMKIPDELSRDAYLSLTEKRADIIKWYPFDKNGSLLEIGAGYGEFTVKLCDKLKKVDAYELKKERINIIQTRCNRYSNLTCYTGFMSEQKFDGLYDYILVHDIFAIARKFFKGDNPNESMLKFLRQFLKDEGKLLLITENRLGLRYFAGAAEDYKRQYYWGLNSFEQDERNRTFSKSELLDIINNSGFTHQKWFYPYPNAVCAMEIFTEEINNKICYGLSVPDYEICEDRFQFFDEQRMFYTLNKEGIGLRFANAFFVECGNHTSKIDVAYVNLEKNKTIFCKKEGVFVQDEKILPEGIRSDFYLSELVQRVVNCNLGDKNPYVQNIYSVIEKIVALMKQTGCDMNDIYINNDEVATVNSNPNIDMYSIWEQWYTWYKNNIMYYRNGIRRISLEKIMKIINIDNITLAEYLNCYQKNESKYCEPRLPGLMFDFEAGGSKDCLNFKISYMEENGTANKLKQLHKTLHTEA